MGEIDNLTSELQTVRRKLQTDGDRIERDIALPAALLGRGHWCGPADTNSASSDHSRRLLTIASVRILAADCIP
jgi:hypothetical protein